MQKKQDKGFLVNDQITVDKVRVIDQNNEMIGVLPTNQAIKRAQEAGFDLIEVALGVSTT